MYRRFADIDERKEMLPFQANPLPLQKKGYSYFISNGGKPEVTPLMQRKFIDWKKTKLFRFRWNWTEEKKLRGIRLQISSFTP